LRKLCWENWL